MASTAANGQLVINASPILTAFSPTSSGLGQQVTISGYNLSSVTGLLINGVDAKASITNNTATSLTFRVPAGAPATGTTTVTTANGSATSTAFTVMPVPGNALSFDGTNDYVALPTGTAVPTGNGAYTIEAWIKPDAMGVEGIIGWGNYGTTNQVNALRLTATGLVNYWWSNDLTVTTGDLTGRWHHVAATFDGTTRTIYLDGVAVGSDTPTGHAVPNANNLRLGSTNNGEYFDGALDEVRVWSTARTAAQVQADMRGVATVPTTGLVLYENMDQGTPGGTNTGLGTVYDLANTYAGTLTNFALTGSTSNWVESYALVVPTATAATSISNNNFTANWTAPATGTVTNYLVDVSTSNTFATAISGSPFTVATGTTSLALSGLAGSTYYYRVRADKASVTGQGAYSNVVSVVVPSATLSCTARTDNALNFDGGSDYVRAAGTLPATGELTLEAWVRPETRAGAGSYGAILNADNYTTGTLHCQLTSNGNLSVGVGGAVDAVSGFTLPLNTWSHVAVVYSASARTLKFYLNGAPQSTASTNAALNVGAQAYTLGAWMNGSTPQRFFDGTIDELRVWNVARTDAQILANYNQALPAQAGLAALYSFDQGTAGGTNTGLTTLSDASGNGRTGTLNTFALTGASSNWVAGNSLAYTLGIASFSPANGSAGGTVTLTGSGLLGATGVSFNGTAATSFTVVNGTTITAVIPAGATSGPVAVTGPCGTVTSASPFTVCPSPVAIAQNLTVALNASGSATVAASALNSGSTPATCGTITLGLRKAGTSPVVTGTANEGSTLTLTAPAGAVFTSITFASYGTPTANSDGSYSVGACHASTSQAVVAAALLGKNSGSILAGNSVFNDPCQGTVKKLVVQATYSTAAPATQLAYGCADLGANSVLLTVTDASGVSSSVAATVTVVDNLAPTAAAQNVAVSVEASGRAYVSPAAVNNGSSDNCGVTNVALSASTFGDCNASSALAFDGTNDYVSLPGGLTTSKSFTFEAWVNYQDNGVWTRIFDFGASTNTWMTLGPRSGYNDNSGYIFFGITTVGGGGAEQRVLTTTAMPTGWHHVAVTLSPNASGGTSTGTIYLDGTAIGTNPGLTLTPADLGTLSNNYLGKSQYADPYFKGQLDEVRIWSVTRSAADINLYKDKSLAGNTAGLLVYYDLNDGAGSTTVLSRGNLASSGNGTLNNFAPATAFVAPGQVPALGTGARTVTLTVSDASGNVSTATATITATVPTLTATTWTGAASTDWSDCRNWTYGVLPSATISATIPASTPGGPVLSGTGTAKDLSIASATALTVASGATLQVYGNWSNAGTPSLAGTVAFLGNAATQTVTGTTSFGTLAVNKSAGTVQLGSSQNINTALAMTSGLLNTGSNQVALGTSATISETEASYVTGTVAVTRTLTPGAAQSFSGLGLTLTPAAGSKAPGATKVVRTTGTALSGAGSSTSVLRYFDIQPATNSGLNVTMEFSYFDHELNSIPKANLRLFKSTTTTSGPWTNMFSTSSTSSSVSRTGLADFSIWTLGNSAAPLPVELAAFTAQAQGATVALAWRTASELHSDRFEVERSTDGTAFGKLGAVAARGTSATATAYAYRDATLPTGATTLYYRLRQVDQDGTFAYSPVRVVAVATGLALFPNPARTSAMLSGAAPTTPVQVLDALGRIVLTNTTDAAGTATLLLPAGLPTGVYVVRAGQQALRLTVE